MANHTLKILQRERLPVIGFLFSKTAAFYSSFSNSSLCDAFKSSGKDNLERGSLHTAVARRAMKKVSEYNNHILLKVFFLVSVTTHSFVKSIFLRHAK